MISFPLFNTWCSSFNLVHSFSLAILRVLSAIWKLFFLAFHFSNFTNFSPTSLPLDNTQCQQDRILSRDPRLKLEFLPRCNADGSYHTIQCSIHLSKCWCVDHTGHKVADAVDGEKGMHCGSKPKGKEFGILVLFLSYHILRRADCLIFVNRFLLRCAEFLFYTFFYLLHSWTCLP